MNNTKIPFNLQFFSEYEEGVEAPEVTEPVEMEDVTDNNTTDEVETVEPSGKTEEDSRFAAIRRKAEEDAKARYEAQTNKINDEFKRVFGKYNNPSTGKPIESWNDYLEAVEAQQRAATENELRSKGVDPALINELVNNSPAIRQANAVIANAQKQEATNRLNADIKAISEIDASIQSISDLAQLETYPQIENYVVNNKLSLVDAFKLANGASIAAKNTAAVKQAAINQAKGKNHLETTNGVAVGSEDMVPIPEKQLSMWKASYPGLSLEDLTKKYNQIL